ncbi:MAG TPA: cysteine--tRNA ligase [Patescibacteria group bacterium]|nr:cysteine--tRNA ligase [Patescibacteria group bacterium]
MIKVYNTLSRSKEEFKPIEEGEVGIYSCGPTVYNFVHIGNLRAYIFADILHRTFLYNGYKVKHIMNITDVDDKTIRDSRSNGLTLKDFTDRYTTSFFEDLEKLNINKEEYIFPRATENIDGMVKLIKKLLDKGFAYKAEDGSIYFAISKFKDYGKLSGVDFERDTKSRISNDEYAKDEAHDFALWKAWDEKDGDVFWETDIGKGRPGWHIECSVMSEDNLGQPFDIHTGGIDLIFPHHENEIAQSEAANEKTFVNYWMHNEMLMVDGQKMSKSLKNDYRLNDIIEKGYEPLVFRYLMLFTGYNQKLNFTWDALEAAKNGLGNLKNKILLLGNDIGEVSASLVDDFKNEINDDLNTPKALAVLQEVLKSDITNADKLATVLDFDKVLGLRLDEVKSETIDIPEDVIKFAEDRKNAKQEKNFELADSLRAKISEAGYEVEDTKDGYRVVRR